jgi:hypothetical protein
MILGGHQSKGLDIWLLASTMHEVSFLLWMNQTKTRNSSSPDLEPAQFCDATFLDETGT